jgi:N-acetylneuraminic acid mutarotase
MTEMTETTELRRLALALARTLAGVGGGAGEVLALAMAAAALACSQPAFFEPATPAPVPRVEGPAAVVGGRLYVFGGFSHYDGDLRATRRIDIYDPRTATWSVAADMPTPTTHRTPAVDGTNVWFAGGFEGDNPGPTVAHVWRYDAAADRWAQGPSLPQPRSAGALVLLDSTLHYFGGFGIDRGDTFGDHWTLDVDGVNYWRKRAPLPCPRGHLAGLALDGRIHAIGGQHGHHRPHPDVDCHHAYLPAEDRWIELAPLPTPRSHFESSAFVWNGRIVVVGGRNNVDDHRTLDDITVYDPRADRWRQAPRLPVALLAPVAAPLEGKLLVTMGSRDDWKHPQTASWRGLLP